MTLNHASIANLLQVADQAIRWFDHGEGDPNVIFTGLRAQLSSLRGQFNEGDDQRDLMRAFEERDHYKALHDADHALVALLRARLGE